MNCKKKKKKESDVIEYSLSRKYVQYFTLVRARKPKFAQTIPSFLFAPFPSFFLLSYSCSFLLFTSFFLAERLDENLVNP